MTGLPPVDHLPMLDLTEHLIWMRVRGLAPDTIRQRRNVIGKANRDLGMSVLAASERDLDAWQRALAVGVITRSNYVGNVKSYFGWAREYGRTESIADRVLIKPRRPRALPRPMPEHDLALAISMAPQPIRLWLVLAGYEGLRAGEIARMQRGDVLDTSEPPVLVVVGKGQRQRVVPISPAVLVELRRFGMPTRGPMFRRPSGVPYPPNDVSRWANRFLHGLGIASTLHSARHRMATELYRASGSDLRLVQEALGHASPSTTSLYVATSVARAVDAVSLLGLTLNEPTHITL